LHPGAIDWVIMGVYFVFVLGVGFTLRRYMKTSTDYFLSGRSIPAWVAGLAFLSANLGAQEVIGMAASGAKYGMATSHFYWVGSPGTRLRAVLRLLVHGLPGGKEPSMGLDIRIPLGLMFTILGFLLVGFGFFSDPAIYQRSLGIDVNLWWGLVLLVFGALMLGLGWRAASSAAQAQSRKPLET
jgi:hypothetical protein